MNDAIESFMTPAVHCIGIGLTLRDAHELMNAHAIRHLPVLEGGKLVGIVSQRDLHLVETLRDVDPKEVPVEEAMSQDVLTVERGTPLAEVARQMGERKCGSAVVVQAGTVVGIFTTVDALRALEQVLAPKKSPRRDGRRGRVVRHA